MGEKALQGIDFLIWECDALLADLHHDRQRIMDMKDALENILADLKKE